MPSIPVHRDAHALSSAAARARAWPRSNAPEGANRCGNGGGTVDTGRRPCGRSASRCDRHRTGHNLVTRCDATIDAGALWFSRIHDRRATMRPSDPPKREEQLRSMFGQPIQLDLLELAPTDERVEADVRSLDRIVGLRLDDPARLMN